MARISAHRVFLVGIESVGRLVHDQDRRIVQDRLRQADAPLESLRQRVDGLIEHGIEFGAAMAALACPSPASPRSRALRR
jgi:hypothetical protein